jgi:hypothetical protein
MTTPALRTVASRDMTTSGLAVEIRRASATRIDAPGVGRWGADRLVAANQPGLVDEGNAPTQATTCPLRAADNLSATFQPADSAA